MGLGLVACAAVAVADARADSAFREPARIVVLTETQLPEVPALHVAPGMLRTWRARATSFESIGALTPRTYTFEGEGEPLRVSGALISVDLFATLGVRPALGRDLARGEDEPGHEDVALLGDGFWRARFAGRADVLGQTLVLDGRRLKIVGVMPPGLDDLFAADVYRPLCYPPPFWQSRDAHVIATVVGRLKPGDSVADAQKDVGGISAAIAAAGDGIRRRWGARVTSLDEYLAELAGPRLTPRGFELAGASTVDVTFARQRYATDAQRADLAKRLTDAVAKVPGVTCVGGASALPYDGWINGFEMEGSRVPPTFPLGTVFSVTSGYFESLRIPLVRGRLFDGRDTAQSRPVAIISARAANRWPAGVDPIGKRVKLYGDARWLEVVGVVGEVNAGQHGRIEAQVYQPFAQQPAGQLTLVVRGEPAGRALAGPVRSALRGVDPAQSFSNLRPASEAITETAGPP